jgi:virulence factor Mce-like protein
VIRLPGRRRRARAADEPRIPRKDRRGRSPVVVGIAALVLIAVATFFGFTKSIPFREGFRVDAVVQSTNAVRANSPVRIAGVNVGKVVGIRRHRDSDMSVLELELDESGLPLHKDATLRIRPRIFLEGNFFVDLSPGSPSAPALSDGDTIPVSQTATPVQLDELLTALQGDTREDLQTAIAEYGRALDGPPGESDAGQDRSVRGETAAESLNDTYADAGPALRGAAIVNDAFRGERDDDLSAALAGLQRTTAALGRSERTLQGFVTSFNQTMAIFGDRRAEVSATLRELERMLPQADRTFATLNASFPATRAFARELLPGVRESGETIEASFPWIAQTRRLVAEDELQGLLRDLRPATNDLARVTEAGLRFFPEQDLLSRCFDRVLLPAGDIVVDEPESRAQFETGVENYKELFYGLVGLAGEGQNFDANGQYVRYQIGGGSTTRSTGRSNLGSEAFFNTAAPSLGTRPAFPGRRPPYRPDQPCFRQELPDVNGAVTGPPDGRPFTGPPAAPAAPATPTGAGGAR